MKRQRANSAGSWFNGHHVHRAADFGGRLLGAGLRSYAGSSTGTEHCDPVGKIRHTSATGRGTVSNTRLVKPAKAYWTLMKSIKPYVEVANTAIKITSDDGLQGVSEIYRAYDYTQHALVKDYAPFKQDDRNPGLSTPNALYQVAVDYNHLKFEIVNHCNHQVNFTIYECTPKFNHSYAPLASWGDGLISQTISTDNTGGGIGGATGVTVEGYSNYPSKPQSSSTFMKHWKILKTTKYCMATGDLHDHYVTIKHPKLLADQDWDSVGGGSRYLFRSHHTVIGFIVIHGIPAPLAADTTKTGFSASALHYVVTNRFSTRARLQDTTKYEGWRLPQLPTGGTTVQTVSVQNHAEDVL